MKLAESETRQIGVEKRWMGLERRAGGGLYVLGILSQVQGETAERF
jgi:hypothetical protein